MSLSLTYADEVSLGLRKVGLSQLSENWSIWLFVHRIYKNSPLDEKFKWKKRHVCLCVRYRSLKILFCDEPKKLFARLLSFCHTDPGKNFFCQCHLDIFFFFRKNKLRHSSLHFYNWMKGWPKFSHGYFKNCIHFPCRTTTKKMTRVPSSLLQLQLPLSAAKISSKI